RQETAHRGSPGKASIKGIDHRARQGRARQESLQRRCAASAKRRRHPSSCEPPFIFIRAIRWQNLSNESRTPFIESATMPIFRLTTVLAVAFASVNLAVAGDLQADGDLQWYR